MTPALATERLCKNFGALRVVQDVDFALGAGARHALIGPNGAGKSTLVNILTGALAPSSGIVRLGGDDVTSLTTERRVVRGLTRTFQINTLFARFSPLEATALAVSQRRGETLNPLRGFSSSGESVDEAFELLASLGLGRDALRPTRELPYGRQRVVEIALALAVKPSVLLLDEPAAGVPASDSHDLIDGIMRLPTSTAVLFIEHDMNLVFRFAQRITVLVAGRTLREGPPDEIAEDPEVRKVYLSDWIAQ
jgi:ABC-type branched-subunit amino acid transport system ATPase component